MSSVASSIDFYVEADAATPSAPPDAASATKRKAKALPSPDAQKKRKLGSSQSQSQSAPDPPDPGRYAKLPPELWQHVFSFCSLADLGRLIQVNRSFLAHLTDVRDVSSSKSDVGRLSLLKSESLWASARNALSTKPPKPLPGFTERQMCQLAWAKRCQFCNKPNELKPGDRIWQKGPGKAGVRPIWPFAINSCGPCLLERCQTDSSLLFSAASVLRPALPFVLLTDDQHYITAYTLQSATTPADVVVGKYYYKQHVEDMSQELAHALSLGSAAAEEWSKGLEARGKDRMRIAENWERWEVKHHWWEEHQDAEHTTPAAPSLIPTSHREHSTSPPRNDSSPVIHAPVPAISCYQHAQARPPTVPPQVFTPQPGSTAPGGRNLQDANEAKANRKLDIERRCRQMNPPIPPNILRHMDSFKAAIQISQPMNDYAWSVLQPRLVAQLPAAQQAETEHVARVAALPPSTTDRRQTDVNSKEAKEVMDREWEDSQRPVRDRLNTIADEFLTQNWDGGGAVTYENSPKFAADLLIYVRRTYHAQKIQEEGSSPENHKSALADTADGSSELVLDHLKWVYDNKVKPLTEQFRKDIFLCYGAGCDGNSRFYGFEGVIQHYGAKHTNKFSVGNVVVAWREAEWPEETPFHPDPMSVKHTYHPTASTTTGHGGYLGGFTRAGTSTPHMHSHLPQVSPGPYGYGGQYNGPFAPPQTPIGGLQGYGYPQQYGTPADGYVNQVNQAHQAMTPPAYGQHAPHHYLQSPAMIGSAIAPPPAVPLGQGIYEAQSGMGDATGHSTSSFDKQVSTVIRLAQEIWKQTSGIKDMPNSLRIYVLLHRVIFQFQVEFSHEPSLNHFIDALSNHEMPKALKNAPGLSCKACQVGALHQHASIYYAKAEERRTYTVLNLLSHFKSQHMPVQPMGLTHGPVPILDWKEDMIELPGERFIAGLIHAPGMDDEKLLLVARVFPKHFPMPLPKIGVIDSHGVASPTSSGRRDASDGPRPGPSRTEEEMEMLGRFELAPESGERTQPSLVGEAELDPHRSALTAEAKEQTTFKDRKRDYEESPPAARRQRFRAGSQHHMSREHPDDGYFAREYHDYAPSPRVTHARPVYDEYTGRRTVFRGQERFYGLPSEHIVFAHARGGSRDSREHDFSSAYARRHYEDEELQAEYRYTNDPSPRDDSSCRGQIAADRFLDDLLPGLAPQVEPLPAPTPPKRIPSPLVPKADDGPRYTPKSSNVSTTEDAVPPIRPHAPPFPRAPSTVSNGSRYDEYHPNRRHMPAPEIGPFSRAGPQRRRDRPHEQRMPSRYYRYMNVAAREDRGSSMSRSQSRRYEEQRRRIDQQETPQPGTIPEHESIYSRNVSVEHPSPETGFYQPARRAPREYVSVQDRSHQYSPPRFRYEDYHGSPHTVYLDQYGHPVHDYEVVRVRADHRQTHGPYMHQAPQYEPEHYQYVPVPYERPPPQRYHSREQHYAYYDERERPIPRRPAPKSEPDFNEALAPEIKVENVPVPMLEGD